MCEDARNEQQCRTNVLSQKATSNSNNEMCLQCLCTCFFAFDLNLSF